MKKLLLFFCLLSGVIATKAQSGLSCIDAVPISNNKPTQDKGEIIIYDLSGKKINAYVLNANENILKIDENALENGVYLYSILINGQTVQSDKVVIIK